MGRLGPPPSSIARLTLVVTKRHGPSLLQGCFPTLVKSPASKFVTVWQPTKMPWDGQKRGQAFVGNPVQDANSRRMAEAPDVSALAAAASADWQDGQIRVDFNNNQITHLVFQTQAHVLPFGICRLSAVSYVWAAFLQRRPGLGSFLGGRQEFWRHFPEAFGGIL